MRPFPPSQSGSKLGRCPVTVTSCVSDGALGAVVGALAAVCGAEETAGEVVRGFLHAGRGAENVPSGGPPKICRAPVVPVPGLLPVPGEGAGVCATHIPRSEALQTMNPATVLITTPRSCIPRVRAFRACRQRWR